ncbi:polycystin-1-like protein 2 [Penaeus vannamei]|uniref:polycystin-1-like protein 2 n=1 Tax=Penaeus vannamei TaxID=6689 RepID=UPI00387F8FDD
MMVAKVTEEMLSTGMKVAVTKGGGDIQLPTSFCPSRSLGKGACNQTITLSAVEWPGVTYSYAQSSDQLSKSTKVVSLDVFLDGQAISVNDTEGIIVSIPRSPEDLPDPIHLDRDEVLARMVHVPIVYTQFNISRPGSAVNIEIMANGTSADRSVLLLDHERVPTPAGYEMLIPLSSIPTNENDIKDLFLNSSDIQNRTGRFFLGLASVLGNVAMETALKNITKDHLDWEPDVSYSLRVFTSGCYYFDEALDEWSNRGLEVVSTSYVMTQCRASHLTSFASGFFPSPNLINFEYIFANAGFTDNMSIYMTLIFTLVGFLVLLVWARFKDREDLKELGVTPLPDNKVDDRYLYEIVVFTGSDKEATCRSNVQMVLSGECGETEVRKLADSERPVFCRNGIDSFVMAVPRPLGKPQYLRVWHDNSGKGCYSSWQLAFVSVRDLQTEEKTTFIANRWLAIDKDDGQIDLTLTAANLGEMTNFSHLYKASKEKGMRDRHLWTSVFYRPPRSRYTRKERVGVCAAFVYLSMMLSAVWYDIAPEKPSTGGFFDLGAFSLSPEQGAVGLISLVAVYPVIQLIVVMFRCAEPWKRKLARSILARDRQRAKQREEMGLGPEVDKGPDVEKGGGGASKKREKDSKQPFTLPWWFRVVAWLLVLAIIGLSVFFVWAYAMQFGAQKTSRWLTSLLVTFLASVLVIEPVMVLIGAVSRATCCSKCVSTRVDEDDVDFDEEKTQLYYDEEWQHVKPLDPAAPRRVHAVKGTSDTSLLQSLRQKLVKEREMMLVLRDILAYLAFVMILGFITYGGRDPSTFLMVSHFRNAFIREGDIYWDYKEKVIHSDRYWLWLRNIMLKELRAQRWYNGEPPYGLRGFLGDKQNRIMGYGILRQVRNKKGVCRPPAGPIREIVTTCTGPRDMNLEDDQDYCAHWGDKEVFPGACNVPEFKYKSADELESFPTYGRLGTYGGGGYVLPVRGSSSEILERLDYLQKVNWIDKYTRAVMLEFSVYNANVNLFGIGTVMAEFLPGGGIRPYWRFDSTRLIQPWTGFGFFILLNEIGFVLATVFFTFREIWKCYKSGLFTYLKGYWNLAEVAIIIISYLAIGLYVLRYMEVSRVLKIFDETYGNGYVRMEYAALLDLFYLYAVAGIIFFSTLKFIKLLQFNKRMNLLGFTFGRCWDDLQIFFLTFGILFIGFTTLFFTIFNLQLEEFANFLASVQMCFSMMLGKFNFEAMAQANQASPVMFFVFSLSTSMILINLMLTIIIKSFTEVKNELKNVKNKYDILDFISYKIMTTLGLQEREFLLHTAEPDITEASQQSETTASVSDEFPSKVDSLLCYINDLYFDGQLDLKNPDGLKAAVGRDIAHEQNLTMRMSAGFDRYFGKLDAKVTNEKTTFDA